MLLVGVVAFRAIAVNRAVFIRSIVARAKLDHLVAIQNEEDRRLRDDLANRAAVVGSVYSKEQASYARQMTELRSELAIPRLNDVAQQLDQLDRDHVLWERRIAAPILLDPGSTAASTLLDRGSTLIDRMDALIGSMSQRLSARSSQIAGIANVAIITWIVLIALLTTTFGLLAVAGERKRRAQELVLRTDIAARNTALERSNQSLQEFAYVASHDMQEPLRTVASFTQLLQKRYAGQLDAQADEYIAFAVDGALRMQRLIADILQYSRLTTHGQNFERVAIGDVIERAQDDLRAVIEERAARVLVGGTMPELLGDPVQLRQLFANLIGNAIKYNISEAPKVTISARREREAWVFRVADNGIGIAPEHHEQIFNMFSRLHSRAEYAGTGIGLALARRIVERHGGRIWVESSEGVGTSFFFTLSVEPA